MSVSEFKKVLDVFKFLRIINLKGKEKEVVESMEKQFEEKKFLTTKQMEYLFDIYGRV
jgi:hypothetical protein